VQLLGSITFHLYGADFWCLLDENIYGLKSRKTKTPKFVTRAIPYQANDLPASLLLYRMPLDSKSIHTYIPYHTERNAKNSYNFLLLVQQSKGGGV